MKSLSPQKTTKISRRNLETHQLTKNQELKDSKTHQLTTSARTKSKELKD